MSDYCINMLLFLGFALLSCTTVESSILRGPSSVVGIVGENVELECRSEESLIVKWMFTPFGRTDEIDESKFPGHHRTSWSSRGYHSLTLEGITFQNAGHYVCRLEGTSGGGVDATAAFVVVVANPPHCTHSGTDQLVTMNCSVTFVGQHNLTLEWLAPDGHVLHRQRYWSGGVPHVARLNLNQREQEWSQYNLSSPVYTCHAHFSNGSTKFVDVASNLPEFRRNTCTVPAPIKSTVESSTHEQTSTLLIIILIVCVLALALVIALSVCGYLILTKKLQSRCLQTEATSANPLNSVVQCSKHNNAAGDVESPQMATESDCRSGNETSASRFTDKPNSVNTQPQDDAGQPLLSERDRQETATNITMTISHQHQPSHQSTRDNIFCTEGIGPRQGGPLEPRNMREKVNEHTSEEPAINSPQNDSSNVSTSEHEATNNTCIQENADADDFPGSPNSTVDNTAGHDNADDNMFNLHEDRPPEDQIG